MWFSYPKIRNIYVDTFSYKGYYVVLEKIHGTNMSIEVLKDSINYYRRKGKIEGNFYDYKDIMKRYNEDLLVLYNILGPYIMYGELYGDGIQKEVRYVKKDFIPFDIYVNDSFLSYEQMCKIMIKTNKFNMLQPLFVGKMKECIKFDVENIDPNKRLSENDSEGVIIRGYDKDYIKDGKRVIFKKKSINFKEKRNERIDNIEDKIKIFNLLDCYVTRSRLSSVLSKEEEEFINEKNITDIARLYIDDIYEDVKEDSEYIKYLEKSPKMVEFVKKKIKAKVFIMIKEYFET